MASAPANRLAILDGYRALAALSVVAYHYTVKFAAPLDLARGSPVDYGWAGVELFFVISGFVILMTLDRSSSVGEFAIRRLARLWPMLVVGAVFTMLVVNVIGPQDWKRGFGDFTTSIFFLKPVGFHWVDGAYWTLAIEIRFYLLAAVAHGISRGSFLRTWLVVQVVSCLAFLFPGSLGDNLLCASYLPYFTFGMCGYSLWAGRGERAAAIWGLALSGGFVFVAPFVRFVSEAGNAVGFDIVNAGILGLFALFLIESPVVRIFGSAPFSRIGEASYSLYLIHQNAGVSILLVLSRMGVPIWVSLPVVTGAAIGLSFLFFRWVEVPAKRWILSYQSGSLPMFALRESMRGPSSVSSFSTSPLSTSSNSSTITSSSSSM